MLALLVDSASRVCALALTDVSEVMRPLPVEPFAGSPAGVLGVAIIRGAPVPVLDLAGVLGGTAIPGTSARFVTVRIGARHVALAVDAVRGVRTLDDSRLQEMPPLLGGAVAGAVAGIAALDATLHVVLAGGRLVPDELWSQL